MVTNVKTVKDYLRDALDKLNAIDENNTCVILLDDDSGGYYESDIKDFSIVIGCDGNVYIGNCQGIC